MPDALEVASTTESNLKRKTRFKAQWEKMV